ncbi:unnamed protein product [Caenorhabditis angaria]|uniref:Epoxide hydrolase n=1 Tax=Caenorhabditis angaria TaxID=860376 RepID=A0A9P1IY06_9PELO|nr:unnamed protein product [Caenorhabditis angaria]
MSSVFFLSIVVISIISVLFSVYIHRPDFPELEIELDNYWKLDDPVKDDDTIYSYSIDVDTNVIDDFKNRLKSEKVFGTSQFLQNLTKVLLDFDWKQHQNFLNTFKQYKTEIEGLNVHFLRISTPISGKKKTLVPILMLHGFPGSFWDFFKLIPILTNPTRYGFDFGVKESIQFEVIIPSLPGFLFSGKSEKNEFDIIASARILGKLMRRLDLQKYFVHGGEGIGSDLATLIASLYPARIQGLHLSNPFVRPTFSTFTLLKYAYNAYQRSENSNYTDIVEYFASDKFAWPSNPDSISTSLGNSAIGTVKYISNLWSLYSLTSSNDTLNLHFTLDEISTEIYLYWITQTLPSALQIHGNSYTSEAIWQSAQVRIPTAIVYSTNTPWRCEPEILSDKYLNLTRVNELPKGGLFHYLQDPNKVAEDIFSFVELQLL